MTGLCFVTECTVSIPNSTFNAKVPKRLEDHCFSSYIKKRCHYILYYAIFYI